MARRFLAATVCAIVIATASGCSRSKYRDLADEETYGVLHQKTAGRPWTVPGSFIVEPSFGSRLEVRSNPNCPDLPPSEPKLYGYTIPGGESEQALPPEASAEDPAESPEEWTPNPSGPALSPAQPVVQAAAIFQDEPSESTELRSVLPPEAWQSIPRSCLIRMFGFETIRQEYLRTFKQQPPEELIDKSRRLTLNEIIELALLNSREYQTQKEALYLAALRLTLRRFDYDLKFSSTGNSTATNFSHNRVNGRTTDTLSVPTRAQVDKALATGGEFLARFANDVVLTFNGPEGFAADIGSELFFSLTQAVLQRDIRFEPLIQAERDVVYAARSFARFRKRFFFDRTSEYYRLILNLRGIEIDTQNYFSLFRELIQNEEEARTEIATSPPRFQVEQIEQQMLAGRSALISTCNDLESSLDSLKQSMGIPTETPLTLDLTELSQLTLRDEGEVSRERVGRAVRRLEFERSKVPEGLDDDEARSARAANLTAAVVLLERLISWVDLRRRSGEQIESSDQLQVQAARFSVEGSRVEVKIVSLELTEAIEATNPKSPEILLFQRTSDTAKRLLDLVENQYQLARLLDLDPFKTLDIKERSDVARERINKISDDQREALRTGELEKTQDNLSALTEVMRELEQLVTSADALIGIPEDTAEPTEQLQQTVAQIDQLVAKATNFLEAANEGLVAVQMQMDDAMLTALLSRFDLMNQRGFLADDWRLIKYAADDLRSVLNLNVSQTIGTKQNRPFGFTFDESRTDLRATLDLPLNRKAQRNSFRSSLINYQVALRNLTALEDQIKFSVRQDLRNLALLRTQYEINVAQAALAFERVRSVRIELNLGLGDVAARDFLEAQDAYRDALLNVARRHIDYNVARTRFFLDLELLQLDDSGFWPEIYDESYQPVARSQFGPEVDLPYGEIPEFLKVSRDIQRMIEAR